MSISGVSDYSSIYSLSELYGTQKTDSAASDIAALIQSGSSTVSGPDSLDVSKPAEIYSKLQALAESDPEKLKEVCAKIAEQLKSASESAEGGKSKMLADLAQKFQNVADGGDVSQLKPPEPPSFCGGPEPPSDAYSKQQDSALASFMNARFGQGSSDNPDELLSMILDEINSAISA